MVQDSERNQPLEREMGGCSRLVWEKIQIVGSTKSSLRVISPGTLMPTVFYLFTPGNTPNFINYRLMKELPGDLKP